MTAIPNIINIITIKAAIIKAINLNMITKIKVITIITNMIIKVKINQGKALTKKTITIGEGTKEMNFKQEINHIIIEINIARAKSTIKSHLISLIRETIFKKTMINL